MSEREKDPFDGSAHERLGIVISGIDWVRNEQWRMRDRLDEGERRMDWIETNVRIILSRQAPHLAPQAALHPILQIGVWLVDWLKDLFNEKGAFKRWLILLIAAWATNTLHLPAAWNETIQHLIGAPSE